VSGYNARDPYARRMFEPFWPTPSANAAPGLRWWSSRWTT